MTVDLAESATEWRAQHIKPALQPKGQPVSELVQHMRRSFCWEALETVPRDAIAAMMFLECGDD